MKIVCVVPARYASVRLPAKALLDICGKPLIQRVYEQAKKAKLVQKVLVATDDERIFNVVKGFKGDALMTKKDHLTGTDRLAEVAQKMSDVDVFVNVQGDEPLIEPTLIDEVVQVLLEDQNADIATAKILMPLEDYADTAKVKVVTDKNDYALYFSRSVIPFIRKRHEGLKIYKHIGIYAYRREFLLQFSKLEPSMPEVVESLEQLRALYYGYKIKVLETNFECVGVDTEEDLKNVVEIIKNVRGGK